MVWRKKSFRSKVINLAPFALWEMVLFKSNFVSSNVAAGDVVLCGYCSRSPPTVKHTRNVSDFNTPFSGRSLENLEKCGQSSCYQPWFGWNFRSYGMVSASLMTLKKKLGKRINDSIHQGHGT